MVTLFLKKQLILYIQQVSVSMFICFLMDRVGERRWWLYKASKRERDLRSNLFILDLKEGNL